LVFVPGGAKLFSSLTIRRFAVLLVKSGLLVLALLLTAFVSGLATMRQVLISQEVVVPSLLEKRIPEAGTLAARQGLLLRVEGKRHDPRVPPERIVAQEPPPGSTLKTHRSIRVWMSLGQRRVAIPGVEGQSLRTAQLALDAAGVSLARVVKVSDPAAEGTILAQRPAAGDADVGEGLSVLVSDGPAAADYLMPDLIGRRVEECLDSLKLAGLKVADVRYRSYPGVAPGIVLRQAPPAGHRVSSRASVSLDVSRSTTP
jgi:beta-lactam-binding protein with PASTA domain